jgi:hypothetical protein
LDTVYPVVASVRGWRVKKLLLTPQLLSYLMGDTLLAAATPVPVRAPNLDDEGGDGGDGGAAPPVHDMAHIAPDVHEGPELVAGRELDADGLRFRGEEGGGRAEVEGNAQGSAERGGDDAHAHDD